eukprot:2736902-Amphidinium_carterae.1
MPGRRHFQTRLYQARLNGRLRAIPWVFHFIARSIGVLALDLHIHLHTSFRTFWVKRGPAFDSIFTNSSCKAGDVVGREFWSLGLGAS